MPSDKEYKWTKLIMQARATINQDFKPLADWIDKTFDVKTVNIIYDSIDNGRRPRLQINFEHYSEEAKFRAESGYGYDEEKQNAIAKAFENSLFHEGISRGGIFNLFSKKSKYTAKNIWVIFSSFEPIARIEANESIPQDKVQQLKQDLNIKEIWEISRCFSGTTFFFYTDKQVAENSNNGMKKFLAEKYFEILKPYDEFNYFKKETFSVNLDSKENFDNNYESNWYYYYYK
jgi:hypothetical protein